MQLQVTGTKLVASSIPFLTEKTRDVVICRFTFDESWNGFSRTAIFRMGGHAAGGQPLIALPLNKNDCAELPALLTSCAKPFCLSVEGENGNCRLRTNTVRLSFRRGERDGLPFTFYDGSYTLTENGTYPTSGELMKSDIRVEVPLVDLSQDTVTPETLAEGVTAHDSKKQKIVGTLDPYASAKLHVGCSTSTAPTDRTKLWLKTDIQPKREFSGYLRPTQRAYETNKLDVLGTVYCEGPDNSMFVFGQYEQTPYLFQLYPDSTRNRKWVLDSAAADSYEWRALDMCFANDRVYVLLGSGGIEEARRAPRVYVFDYITQTGFVHTTVDQNTYGSIYGGITLANDGNVYLFVCGSFTRFYRYYVGTEVTIQIANVIKGYEDGSNGMVTGKDGKLYTLRHDYSLGDALCFDPKTKTVEQWAVGQNTELGSLDVLGGYGEYMFVRNDNALFYLHIPTAKCDVLPLYLYDETGENFVWCRSWRVAGNQLFLIMQDIDGVLFSGTLERVCAQPGVYLVQKRGDGALCTIQQTPVGNISAVLSMALATDANGFWKPCPLYRYSSGGQWAEVK